MLLGCAGLVVVSLGVASAAPEPAWSDVEIAVLGRPRPVGWRTPVRDTVPAPVRVVAVDGQDDAAWAQVPEAPPLQPLLTGPAPPEARLHVVRSAGQIVVRLPTPAPGWTQRLALDPDGAGEAWWAVDVGALAGARRCALAPDVFPRGADPLVLPTKAAPCTPTDDVVVASGVVVEVAFPARGLTGQARLAWAMVGPKGAGGTWAPSGVAEPRPEWGRRLQLPVLAAKVTRVADAAEAVWRYAVEAPKGPAGAWTWTRRWLGVVVEQGRFTVPEGGGATFEVPWRGRPQGVVELRAEPAPGSRPDAVRPTWIQPVSDPEARAWLRTPVVDGVLELGWTTPAPLAGVVVAWGPPGQPPTGRARVDLPAGNGWLRVPVPGREPELAVTVTVLAPTPLRAVRR